MIAARKVALRVNGARAANARVRRSQNRPELVITDQELGEFIADDSFSFELLELSVAPTIRSRLPHGGWRKVSLKILVALVGGEVVQVVREN